LTAVAPASCACSGLMIQLIRPAYPPLGSLSQFAPQPVCDPERPVHDPLAIEATVADLLPKPLTYGGPFAIMLELREHVPHRFQDGEAVAIG